LARPQGSGLIVQGLVRDPAPLQPARSILHEGVAAERDRTGSVRQGFMERVGALRPIMDS
jgi:hypothetical protein